MSDLTEGDMLELLKTKIGESGSLRRFARQSGLSAAFISQVVNQRLPVSPKLAAFLGYERLTIYRKGAK